MRANGNRQIEPARRCKQPSSRAVVCWPNQAAVKQRGNRLQTSRKQARNCGTKENEERYFYTGIRWDARPRDPYPRAPNPIAVSVYCRDSSPNFSSQTFLHCQDSNLYHCLLFIRRASIMTSRTLLTSSILSWIRTAGAFLMSFISAFSSDSMDVGSSSKRLRLSKSAFCTSF